MAGRWLSEEEREAWLGVASVVELLPGVLDAQLRRDAQLTFFEYMVLAVLSEAPDRTVQMSELARHTNATLPRLSHVVRRLADRGLLDKVPCPHDARATNAQLTETGWATLREAAPGHVANVREHVFGSLSDDQVTQLAEITQALLTRLDPEGRLRPLDPSPGTAPDH